MIVHRQKKKNGMLVKIDKKRAECLLKNTLKI